MIFSPTKDEAIAAELRALSAAGGIPALLMLYQGGPVHVGLVDDSLAIISPSRVTFDAAAGVRIEPEPTLAPEGEPDPEGNPSP